MQKGFVAFCIALVAFLVVGVFSVFVQAGDVSQFSVDINGPTPYVAVLNVSVPDSVYLGVVKVGGETNKSKVTVSNTGNVAIVVTPSLVNSSDALFANLYFQRRVADSFRRIGNFSLNLTAPAEGDTTDDYFYVKLDLKNYNGTFPEGSVTRVNSNVKFFVAAA